MTSFPASSLRARLAYEPAPLKFGTSGRRGLVADLTQLEIYINAAAELEYLQSLPSAAGGIAKGDEFYYACDLRPSSSRRDPQQQGRGELAQAIARAMVDAGMKPVFLGQIPTPALAAFALARCRGSMMVTGSHIPFDRNGYKTNTARGELLKKDEAPIEALVGQVRQRLYAQDFAASAFDARGMLKSGPADLPAPELAAQEAYLRRYTDLFAGLSLKGKRLLAYQHSAVGRDLLVELLRRLGAEVIPVGRSETFVPIDTENIDAAQLELIQGLAKEAWRQYGPIDAVVSTDGDSDRPLILGVEAGGGAEVCRVRFFGGDLVGMVVAETLGADAVVVPISCNDAVDRGPLADKVLPKTRIGSPFVVEGMERALAAGRKAVCGWEANGGFLTGSDIEREGWVLTALPTRDAFLPILGVLFAAGRKGISVSAVFDQLPHRFSRAALLKNFPRPASHRIIDWLSLPDVRVKEVRFAPSGVVCFDAEGREIPAIPSASAAALEVRARLARFFPSASGFDEIQRLNYIDGVRIYFSNGDVAHVRPSGNADELRIYAVADTLERAEAIAHTGVAEPGGILRQLEAAVRERSADFQSAVSPICNRQEVGVSQVHCVSESPAEWNSAIQQIGNLRYDAAAAANPLPTNNAVEEFVRCPGLVRLEGVVQHYDWGGFDFIPALLGQPHPSARPCAELWMGSHPKAPSLARFEQAQAALTRLIEQAPAALLGKKVAARFQNRLPFLFKVLDAHKMLSIQAHPTLAQAAEGFRRENAAGIALDAPNRNYKDDNHKPEVHVALTEFWMLHGFRPLEEIAAMMKTAPEIGDLMPDFCSRLGQAGADETRRENLLRGLYEKAMNLPQVEVDAILNQLLARLQNGPAPAKEHSDFWALRAAEYFPLPGGHRDRGIFSIYLLNLVRLKPGEGTYQPAGTLHAYLEGVNVELMANSDNVLRGGLTPKHVEVGELMRVLKFSSGKPSLLQGEPRSPAETVYPTPAEEFELSQIRLAAGGNYRSSGSPGPAILLVLDGAVSVSAGTQTLALERGGIVFVPAAVAYTLALRGDSALIFKAATPHIRT